MSNKELPDKSAKKPRGIRNHFRLLVRFVCLIGAVLCLLPIRDKDALLSLVPALSPFVTVTSILATKTIQPILALGLVTGLVAIFRHRWFCRWACPTGLCLDGASCPVLNLYMVYTSELTSHFCHITKISRTHRRF